MALNTFKQDAFDLGMNRLSEPTALQQGEYALLNNGRVRFGGVSLIKKPLEITNIPSGKKQGIIGTDRFLIVIQGGLAYYRDFSSSQGNFLLVPNFQMDANVDEVFMEIIPASTMNYQRLPTTDSGQVIANAAVTFQLPSSNTPAAIVVQDGINQPWLIFPDGSARQAGTYATWTNDPDGAREYIPVGKQMLFSNGILYVIGLDGNGNYTSIMRSVTGRPADFMVIIDQDGNKMPTEGEGQAANVAYRVDFGSLTCINHVGGENGGFYVSTNKASYLVIPDTTNLIFGEPTFSNQFLFTTGAVNNNSVTDVSGDAALIDFIGLRSFNAVLTTRFEGKNSPFSAKIQFMLGKLTQSVSAAVSFDNYVYFGVQTIYGPGVIVFDTMLQTSDEGKGVWVSIDLFDNVVTPIRQWAAIKTIYSRGLFFITTDNRLYQYEASPTTAPGGIYLGEWTAGDVGKEQKPITLALNFTDILESGTITATCYLDSYTELSLTRAISLTDPVTPEVEGSVTLPFGDTSKSNVQNPTIDFSSVSYGWKTGFWLQWDFAAQLIKATYVADIRACKVGLKDIAQQFTDFQK